MVVMMVIIAQPQIPATVELVKALQLFVLLLINVTLQAIGLGVCSNPTQADGTSCNADNNACTVGDDCVSGVCVPGSAVECVNPPPCYTNGTCNTGTGNCNYQPVTDNLVCNDNNPCTTGDSCTGGVCSGSAVVCNTAPDQCHTANGTCTGSVKKGQVLAEALGPRAGRRVKQKQAAVEQAIAKRKQAEAAVRVAEANVTGAEAKLVEVRAGTRRVEADLARWQAEFHRVEELHAARAQHGQSARRDPEQAPLLRGRLRGDRGPDQYGGCGPDPKPAPHSIQPVPMSLPRLPPSTSPRRTRAPSMRASAYTKIEAPFDGIVTQRNVNTGDLTQPGADKPPLFIVARSDIMTIRVNVPEAFAAEVNPGDRAAVRLQEMKGKTVEGKVTRVSWAIDPKMRTLRVEIDIPNPGREASARPLRLRDRHRRRAP